MEISWCFTSLFSTNYLLKNISLHEMEKSVLIDGLGQ